MIEYLLVIHPAEEGGFWAEIPALPGCFVDGDTMDQLLADAPEAIAAHLEALKEDGQEIPTEALTIARVQLPIDPAAQRSRMPELRNVKPLDAVAAFERAGGTRRK
jgi:predicted RNase H-like HicB family nuclease